MPSLTPLHQKQPFHHQWNLFSVYCISGIFSLFLSYWKVLHKAVVNPDGICYLLSAEVMKQDGLIRGMQLCSQAKWPFYSFLIEQITRVLSCSMIHAAYLLNAFFSCITVLSFIAIIQLQGASQRVCCMASGVILCAEYFNRMREYVIRDHGYLAFYLLSILFLFSYIKKPRGLFAAAFSLSLLLATLFRIEGAIFLLLLPFFIFTFSDDSWRKRIDYFFQLSLLLILSFGFILTFIFFFGSKEKLSLLLGRLPELWMQLKHGFFIFLERYKSTELILLKHILPQDGASDVNLILILLLLLWYSVRVITDLSLGYSLLIFYAIYHNVFPFSKKVRLAWVAYITINILITFFFLGEKFFLSKRYLMALSLTLMLGVPYALDHLLSRWNRRKYRLLTMIVFLIFLMNALSGFFSFGYSKHYIHDAGTWLALHIPKQALIYANDLQVLYYSNHFGTHLFQEIDKNNITTISNDNDCRNYDYCIWRINKNNELLYDHVLQNVKLRQIKTFSNKRGDKVIIAVRRINEEKQEGEKS